VMVFVLQSLIVALLSKDCRAEITVMVSLPKQDTYLNPLIIDAWQTLICIVF
jgi:hypothetical protein